MFGFAWHWKSFCSKFLRSVGNKQRTRLPPLASVATRQDDDVISVNLPIISETSHLAALYSSMTLPPDGIHSVDGNLWSWIYKTQRPTFLYFLPYWHGMISSLHQSKKSMWEHHETVKRYAHLQPLYFTSKIVSWPGLVRAVQVVTNVELWSCKCRVAATRKQEISKPSFVASSAQPLSKTGDRTSILIQYFYRIDGPSWWTNCVFLAPYQLLIYQTSLWCSRKGVHAFFSLVGW